MSCKFTGEHTCGSVISIKLLCNSRTVRRVMNKVDYKCLRSRKKGVLSKSDIAKRLRYCKDKIKNQIGQEFWSYGVSLYLDGTVVTKIGNDHKQPETTTNHQQTKTNHDKLSQTTSKRAQIPQSTNKRLQNTSKRTLTTSKQL